MGNSSGDIIFFMFLITLILLGQIFAPSNKPAITLQGELICIKNNSMYTLQADAYTLVEGYVIVKDSIAYSKDTCIKRKEDESN